MIVTVTKQAGDIQVSRSVEFEIEGSPTLAEILDILEGGKWIKKAEVSAPQEEDEEHPDSVPLSISNDKAREIADQIAARNRAV